MSELLVTSLLALHLLCVNVASAGPLVILWLEWRDAHGDQLAGAAGRCLAWTSVALLLVGACLGLLIGWWQWNPEYRSVLELFQRRVYFGVWEFFFSLVLMVIGAVWWSCTARTRPWRRMVRGLCQFLAGTNLLYHFPFLFVIISDVWKKRVETPVQPVTGADFRNLIADSSVLARVTHIVLASFAVTGLILIGFAIRQSARGHAVAANRAARWGGRLALGVSVAQLPVGVWLLLQLPRSSQTALIGGDPIGSALLGLSILLSLGLLHALSSVAMGDSTNKSRYQSILLMVVVVFLMTGVLRRI